jgi:hypothetical protein
VVSGPHLDAEVVEHLTDIVRVHALDLEGHRSPTIDRGRRPEDPHAGNIRQKT